MNNLRIIIFSGLLSIFITSCIPGSDSYNDGPSNLEVANVFTNNMSIPQGVEFSIWGKAYKTTKIKVELNESSVSAITKKDGNWLVKLPSQKVGGPYLLKIYTNDTTVVFRNIMIISE